MLGIMLEPGGLIKNPAVQTAIEVAPEVPLAKRPSPKGINPIMLLPKKTKAGTRCGPRLFIIPGQRPNAVQPLQLAERAEGRPRCTCFR